VRRDIEITSRKRGGNTVSKREATNILAVLRAAEETDELPAIRYGRVDILGSVALWGQVANTSLRPKAIAKVRSILRRKFGDKFIVRKVYKRYPQH